jgi:hypothetical protein
MAGDDRVRYCQECGLNVYNLSAMTRPEAEAFLERREGRACTRLYRRGDGTILTRDCPVGLRAIRRRAALLFAVIATLVLTGSVYLLGPSGTSTGGAGCPSTGKTSLVDSGMAWLRQHEPFRSLIEWLDPTPEVPENIQMGW